jgi:hypothetical protein
MKPLNEENFIARKSNIFKALLILKQGKVDAKPSKGRIIDPRSGLTGTLKTRYTESIQSVTLTIPIFLEGSLRTNLRDKGIIVGRPVGSLLTRGIELFQEASG